MSKIKLEHQTPEQKACLGRVYQFIIERGRRNRANAEKEQRSADSSVSGIDAEQRRISGKQKSV
jgi:hypothetical protein